MMLLILFIDQLKKLSQWSDNIKFLYIMSYSFCELSIKIKVPLNAVGVIIRSDGTRIEMKCKDIYKYLNHFI